MEQGLTDSVGLYGIKGNEICFKNRADLPGNSLSVARGCCVCTMIEAKKTQKGTKLFHFERHKNRLVDAVKFLDQDIEHENIEGFGNLEENLLGSKDKPGLVERCGFDESLVAVYITDTTNDGFNEIDKPKVYARVYKENRHTKPMHIATTMRYQRMFPSVKTTFYLPGKKAMKEAELQLGPHVEEVVYIDQHTGEVLEGTRSNICILRKEHELITPDPLSGKVLPGITMRILVEIASKKGVFINKGILRAKDLFAVGTVGIIMTSTTGVVPVCSVDGREVPTSEKTFEICEWFEEYRREYYDNR